jgi:hypothetical protein
LLFVVVGVLGGWSVGVLVVRVVLVSKGLAYGYADGDGYYVVLDSIMVVVGEKTTIRLADLICVLGLHHLPLQASDL